MILRYAVVIDKSSEILQASAACKTITALTGASLIFYSLRARIGRALTWMSLADKMLFMIPYGSIAFLNILQVHAYL